MNNWSPKWNPDRKLATEEIRRYLLDRIPGFVEACDAAKKTEGQPCVTYACEDLICNPSTATLLGWAVLYAHHTNVNFLLLHKGNLQSPLKEPEPEPELDEPDQDMTTEEMKVEIDKILPGYTGAVQESMKDPKKLHVALHPEQFRPIWTEFEMMGMALKYAQMHGVVCMGLLGIPIRSGEMDAREALKLDE